MRVGRIAVVSYDGIQPRLVIDLGDDRLLDLRRAIAVYLLGRGATEQAAQHIAAVLVPGSLTGLLAGGEPTLDLVREVATAGGNGEYSESVTDAAAASWLSPVDPAVLRDFMSFEEHIINASNRLGRSAPQVVYDTPVYYKGNPTTLVGHDTEIVWPSYTKAMDYELELGFVVGRTGSDLTPEQAAPVIFGVTAFNDFSARDIQGTEMEGGLGPAKGKDFASAVGPWVVTTDEVDLGALEMVARVNGGEVARGSSGSAMWQPAELLAWASAGETLHPGDLIGSGTLGGGCGLETGTLLAPGDVVELEVTGVGVLRNRIGSPAADGWAPKRRVPAYPAPAS